MKSRSTHQEGGTGNLDYDNKNVKFRKKNSYEFQ